MNALASAAGTTSDGHTAADETNAAVRRAVRSVTDPEYPDISIADLGLVERIDLEATADADHAGSVHVSVSLIPTFSGCPALSMIAADVAAAVGAVAGVESVTVDWLSNPVWSVERVTPAARAALRNDYTVVLRRKDGALRCPVCGSDAVSDQSDAGPTRCRSVAWCESCRNVVEVMR